MNGAIITIDTNEAMHHPEFAKMQWDGALTVTGNLEFGDVQIQFPDGGIVLIERKANDDFLNSIKDRRLFNQVAEMVEKTKWSYVTISYPFYKDKNGYACYRNGDVTKYDTVTMDGVPAKSTNWQWHAIQGVLLSIQEMGAAIIYDSDFHGAVGRIGNRSRSAIKIAPRRDAYVFSPAEKIMTSFDGIGLVKAQKFLELFGTVAIALTALTAPHDGKKNTVAGWGKKSRDNLVLQLGDAVEFRTDE